MQEHIDGGSDIYFHEKNETLLSVKIQCRHTSSKRRKYARGVIFMWQIKYVYVCLEFLCGDCYRGLHFCELNVQINMSMYIQLFNINV